ncbi:TetR/AcrR family transcriptional regulator [Streptomyces sp. ODS28]|uniref:TetR/AcrR family transcriptional regulator n=1 Tax=Streptomyces sp. ODS28 TaxID=3136688 RepID=UPI0031EFF884
MTSGDRRLQPRKQPRQARAELTRQRILDAAAHVFAEYGYAAGTTNRIAEQAGISIGSLYQYYPNKDAILAELVGRHLADGAEAIGEAIRRSEEAEPPGTLEDTVRTLIRTAVENHLEDPRLLRIMAEQAPRSPELVERVAQQEQARTAYVRELIGRYPEVRVADPAVAARLVVATVQFTVHSLIAAPDPVDVAAFENELVSMITRYLTGGPAGTA